MQQRVWYGFSIIILEVDSVRVFGDKLKLSCITAVPQEHHRPCLIINLSEKSDEGMPSVEDTTDR